jgi:pyrimidine-nucleoside phosphorylase
MTYLPAELIKKKKQGGTHSADEIRWLIDSYTHGRLKDYQMSAWAMAVWFKGMDSDEIAVLTDAMFRSGAKFDFSNLSGPRIDKHSTGGIGDKTSILVGPILAAAKVYAPMIAGRGLGHTGGTLDKMEAIPGFRVVLSRQEFESHVAQHYFSMMSQTDDICPADKKLYALRDVTATVDSLPLICGSIMSKKLAEDLTGLVLDVKFGSGALMKKLPDALELAKTLKTTGEKNGIKVAALITNMNEPLGRFAGNAVEVHESYEILQGKTCLHNGHDFYATTRELSVELAAYALLLAGRSDGVVGARAQANELLQSGAALRAFESMMQYQGPADLHRLPNAKYSKELKTSRSGIVQSMDAEAIGMACVELGVGRKAAGDAIDPTAGIEMFVRIGDNIRAGEPLCRYFSNDPSALDHAGLLLGRAIEIGDKSPEKLPLVAKVLA